MNEVVEVKFTVEQINQILNYLGEVPAKYSLDLIKFIRETAQSQIGVADGRQEEVLEEDALTEEVSGAEM